MPDIFPWLYIPSERIVHSKPGAFREFTCVVCGGFYYIRLGTDSRFKTCCPSCRDEHHRRLAQAGHIRRKLARKRGES